jgi:hypothetical protein
VDIGGRITRIKKERFYIEARKQAPRPVKGRAGKFGSLDLDVRFRKVYAEKSAGLC